MTHEDVTRRPPIPLYTVAPRTGGYAYHVGVWDLCIIRRVSARWVTLRARWVTLRARWVTLRACWVTLRARWVTLRARWVPLRAR
jgi:hypothetical protein